MNASGPARLERRARLADCLRRAQAGEAGALDQVVRELNPLLWHVARSQGASPDEAVDVVQTTWLELVRHLSDIRSAEALTAWLVSVTKREAWQANRRARRATPTDEIDDRPAVGDALDAGLLSDERSTVLWRCFQQLSARCQQLLRIVAAVDRPDYASVSEALGMPHGSIGPTRGRCLTKLRDLLVTDSAWQT